MTEIFIIYLDSQQYNKSFIQKTISKLQLTFKIKTPSLTFEEPAVLQNFVKRLYD